MSICNRVTNDAMTTIYAGIRTLSGIRFFNKAITMFEHIKTNVVASPIDIPLSADEVVPKVGHIPRRRTNVGFSLTKPLKNTFQLFILLN
jgi:hypothetical protein